MHIMSRYNLPPFLRWIEGMFYSLPRFIGVKIISSVRVPVARRVGIVCAAITLLADALIASLIFINDGQQFSVALSWFALCAFGSVAVVGIIAIFSWIEYLPPFSEENSEAQARQITIQHKPSQQKNAVSKLAIHVRAFSVPKEDDITATPVTSKVGDTNAGDDAYKWEIHEQILRCAIADGVSLSFLPARWARILTSRFVAQNEEITQPQQFMTWLMQCSQEWHTWLTQEWIPKANRINGSERDWSSERARGAQATFAACSLSRQQISPMGTVDVYMLAIGDANIFLLRPPQANTGDTWHYLAFPNKNKGDFGLTPATLTTTPDDIERTLPLLKSAVYSMRRGDYLLFTTDALAKWIITQIDRGKPPWTTLLALNDPLSFSQFIQRERQEKLETDDTTMMLVHLQ